MRRSNGPPLVLETVDGRTAARTAAVPSSATDRAKQPRSAWRGRWRLAVAACLLALAYALLRRWLKTAPLWEWQQHALAVDTSPSLPVDGLLVLGYSVDHAAGTPTAPLVDRLELASNITCAQRIPVVIFSGGAAPRIPLSDATEADVMAATFSRIFRERCHPSRPEPRYILEHTSSSTLENARHTLALLLRLPPQELAPLRHLQLVTNRFHQRRALGTFEYVERQRLLGIQAAQQARLARSDAPDGTLDDADARAARESHRFTFSMAPMPLARSGAVPQLDFWREVAATALYIARGWW